MHIHRKTSKLLSYLCLIFVFTTSLKQELATAAAPVSYSGLNLKSRSLASYTLKSGDQIELKVYREDDLATKTKVDKGGTIALPLIGEVKIGGMTVRDARLLITQLYEKDYLVNPQVTLTYTPYIEGAGRFTVLGSVTDAGSMEMPKGIEKIPLLEAIAMAGGFTRYANRSSVKIKRKEGNIEKVFEISAKKLSDDPDTPQFFVLPGDRINVPERVF